MPLARFLKDEIFDRIISVYFARPDLQFRWRGIEMDDAEAQESIDASRTATMRTTINEWRRKNDLDPFPYPEADEPVLITKTGITFLKGALEAQEQKAQLALQAGQAALAAAKSGAQNGGGDAPPPRRPGPRPVTKAQQPSAQGRPPAPVIVVRHPKTDLNGTADDGAKEEERFRGWLDVPTNEEGKRDSDAMAKEIDAAFTVCRVLTTDLQRGTYLAQAISDAAGCPAPEASQTFRTWNLGDLAGKPVSGANLDMYLDRVRNPTVPLPGGESFGDFLGRFLPALKQALDAAPTDGSTLVIVTHTTNIRTVLDWISGDQSDTTRVTPDTLLSDKDPVQPGGYIALRPAAGGRWTVDRPQSNEEDGSGDDEGDKDKALSVFRRKALRAIARGRSAAVRFQDDSLEPADVETIRVALAKAETADEVKRVFDALREENRHPDWLTRSGDELERSMRAMTKAIFARRAAELRTADA